MSWFTRYWGKFSYLLETCLCKRFDKYHFWWEACKVVSWQTLERRRRRRKGSRCERQIVDGVRMQTGRNSRDVIILAVVDVLNGQKRHHPYDSGNARYWMSWVMLHTGGFGREQGGWKGEKVLKVQKLNLLLYNRLSSGVPLKRQKRFAIQALEQQPPPSFFAFHCCCMHSACLAFTPLWFCSPNAVLVLHIQFLPLKLQRSLPHPQHQYLKFDNKISVDFKIMVDFRNVYSACWIFRLDSHWWSTIVRRRTVEICVSLIYGVGWILHLCISESPNGISMQQQTASYLKL